MDAGKAPGMSEAQEDGFMKGFRETISEAKAPPMDVRDVLGVSARVPHGIVSIRGFRTFLLHLLFVSKSVFSFYETRETVYKTFPFLYRMSSKTALLFLVP